MRKIITRSVAATAAALALLATLAHAPAPAQPTTKLALHVLATCYGCKQS